MERNRKVKNKNKTYFGVFFGSVKVSSFEFEMIDFDVWASVSVSKGGGTQQ